MIPALLILFIVTEISRIADDDDGRALPQREGGKKSAPWLVN